MNKTSIKKCLKEFGLKTGDVLIVHSSLSSIGHIEGGADTLIDAFLETIGSEGTLVAPVFGNLGIFTSTLKKRPEAVVSDCPLGTVAAIGADAEFICRDHWKAETAHGENTPYMKIAGLGGYICLLGVDQDRNTTLHSVEALLELPYLKEETAKLGSGKEKSWKYYPGPHRDFIGIDNIMHEKGVMKVEKIGNAVVRLIKSKDMIDIFLELGKEDPAFCLCENKNCGDCVKQRAAIRKARLSKEDFKLSIASSIAGRYIPEMIENLHSAGLEYIELDYIQGRPVHTSSVDKVKKAVKELTDSNIKISALRINVIPLKLDKILEVLNKAGIADLILPLSKDAPQFLKQATLSGINISFSNNSISSLYAADIMKGMKAGFVFSPANFAVAGEKPFLESFQSGRFRKYTTQLDIEDALFDGTATTWTSGNGEIKEIVSILRCASFSGFMNISGKNRNLGNARDLAEQFVHLLK